MKVAKLKAGQSFPETPTPKFGQSSGNIHAASGSGKARSWLGGVQGGGDNTGAIIDAAFTASDYKPVSLNSLKEKLSTSSSSSSAAINSASRLVIPSNIGVELNPVLGGGLFFGSLTLIAGEPGVGKSTLLIQVAAAVAGDGDSSGDSTNVCQTVLYVSGEENELQLAHRSRRLGISDDADIHLLCCADVEAIAEIILNRRTNNLPPFSFVVIDSLHTMHTSQCSTPTSAAGTISQVKSSCEQFLRLSKSTGVPIVLAGHVTKDGIAAGPRTVEHMVDTVLYLEHDRSSVSSGGSGNTGSSLRLLRASKNRYGDAQEVGVFEVDCSAGSNGKLVSVVDPSSAFTGERSADCSGVEGCAVVLAKEGSRVLAFEIQALVTKAHGSSSSGNFVRKQADGIPTGRVALLMAVLDKRLNLSFNRREVFVNVVGGLRLGSSDGGRKGGISTGPADKDSDLATALSLVSSLTGIPVRRDTAFCGEVGLTGEVRGVLSGDRGGVDKRVNEGKRMGFKRVVVGGKGKGKGVKTVRNGVEVVEVQSLLEAVNEGLVRRLPERVVKKKVENRGRVATDIGGDSNNRNLGKARFLKARMEDRDGAANVMEKFRQFREGGQGEGDEEEEGYDMEEGGGRDEI